MKKVVSIILAFCIMALVSCTERKAESHTDEKQTSTAETTTTTLDVTEDDTNVLIDPINVPDYATKKFDKIYEITPYYNNKVAISIYASNGDLIKSLIVSLLTIIISLFVGIQIFKKQDVK